MGRRLSCLSLLCGLALLTQQSVASAGSAISVPPEARDTAAAAIAAAQEIVDKKQEALYRAEATTYAQRAEIEAAEAQVQADEAEKAINQHMLTAAQTATKAQAAAKQAQEAVASATALTAEAKQAIAVADEAYQFADAIEAALQAEEAVQGRSAPARPGVPVTIEQEKAKPRTLEDTDELLKLEKEIKMMEKAQKDADLGRLRNIPILEVQETPAIDWSRAEAAHSRAERLNQLATAIDKRAEQAEIAADKQTVAAEAAAYEAAEAKQALLDAQLIAASSKEYAFQAKDYAKQTKTELEQLIYSQEHPEGAHFFSAGMNYYRAHNELGFRGYQFTQPLYYGYWQKDFSYGLSTKYITSQNNTSGASGRVATLSDTTLTVSKTNEKPKFIVNYGLSVNIPTGKAALSWPERYAMMNEDIVEVSQFGKGWQFTPAIDVSWKIGQEDMWTIGTSYAFSNSYDPTSDILNDNVSPGGEWRRFLRWQHAGQDWQFVGELINTATNPTKIANGDQYITGDQWDYRLTYNKKLPPNQDIMFYYWRETQNMNNTLPFGTSNGLVHYLGTMWSKKLDDKHKLRVTFDVMTTDGSRYSGIGNYYDGSGNPQYTSIDVDGRTKYTLGVGYDIKINATSNLSIDLQRFQMKDGQSTSGQPATTYKGFNVLTKYNKSI